LCPLSFHFSLPFYAALGGIVNSSHPYLTWAIMPSALALDFTHA